jgi:hypothetical protein
VKKLKVESTSAVARGFSLLSACDGQACHKMRTPYELLVVLIFPVLFALSAAHLSSNATWTPAGRDVARTRSGSDGAISIVEQSGTASTSPTNASDGALLKHGCFPDSASPLPQTKPRHPHCRKDLNGCCPRLIKHVLLLHTPKTGGTALRMWLGKIAPRVPAIAQRKRYHGNDDDASYMCACHAVAQMKAGGAGTFFAKSDIVAVHGDASVAWALKKYDPEAFRYTLIILTARSPVQRDISLYYHFKREYSKTAQYRAAAGASLRDFLKMGIDEGFGKPNHNAWTRALGSGDYCAVQCAAVGVPTQPTLPDLASEKDCSTWRQRYTAAVDFLDQDVCAVFVSGQAEASLQTLAHALQLPAGLPTGRIAAVAALPELPTVNHFEFRTKEFEARVGKAELLDEGVTRMPSGLWSVSPDLQRLFDSYNAWDNALYEKVLARLAEDAAVARKAARFSLH